VDRAQAKEILSLYRPWAPDQDDPELAQALELAKRDPELAHWLAEHCALQEALRAKFSEAAVPEGLMEQIISERKAHLMRGRRRNAVLAAAVAIALFVLIGVMNHHPQPPEDKGFSDFRHQMAATVLRSYPKMDLETADLAQIRQFLVRTQAHGDYILPKGLQAATPTGCATLNWQGHRVAMICFNSGKSAASTVPDLFLFVVNRSALADAPNTGSKEVVPIVSLETASWSQGDKTYVLGGFGNEDFLRQYF